MSDSAAAERVGRYQLLDPIGVGPSGAVSRAKVFGVAGFERQFAVKRFHPELTASATSAQALSAAARAYGSLEHPRIARMSEFGVAQGQTFTAVEFVAGLDALRLVAEARVSGVTLAAGGALALVSQAARAIGYAHGRGLSHLGLSPTNVIITADGDVKITDFGILAATLPQQPTSVARLANRIAYLTPEQLASEATSAATDVFALGVIAYELVTGQRTFRGDTPAQIAQSIMTGPPAEPALPRPIVRVLQRCLARSPFERFPDARALADALDAALRVAPVPGTRKDIGAQVAATLERLAALNDGGMSGVVALNLGTGPISRVSDPGRFEARGPEPVTEDIAATNEFVRPDVPVPGPSPLVGPGSPFGGPSQLGGLARGDSPATTMPDLPRLPLTTMTGLPPPPIPVPQGLSSPPSPPPPPSPGAPNTLLGMQRPPPIPSVRGREVGGNVAAVPSLPRPRTGPVPTVPRAESPRTPGEISRARAESPRASASRDSGDIPTARDPASADRDSGDLATRDYGEAGPPLRPSDALTLAGTPPDSLLSASRPSDTAIPTRPSDASTVTARPSEFPTVIRPPIELPPVPDQRAGDSSRNAAPRPAAPGDSSRNAAPRTPTPPPRPPARTPTPPAVPVTPSPPISRAPAAVDALFDPIGQYAAPPTPSPEDATPAPLFQASAFEADLPADESQPRVLQIVAEPPTVPGLGPHRPPTQPPPPYSMAPPSVSTAPTYSVTPPSVPTESAYPMMSTYPTPASPPRQPLPATSRPMPTVGAGMVGARKTGSKAWLWIVATLLVLGGAGAIVAWKVLGWFDDDTDNVGQSKPRDAAQVATAPDDAGSAAAASDATQAAMTPNDAALVATTPDDAAPAAVDATQVATAGDAQTAADGAQVAMAADAATTPHDAAVVATAIDAGTRAPSDAGIVQTPGVGELAIASTPAGARVFLGGADQGLTPVKLPGTTDRHTIALVLAGHELYVAQVDGHGSFTIPLPEITPSSGPAGIKVLKCAKDRYYVFVDGKPTGQLCPTERIGCETGPHTVEVYDVVSETRRKWEIEVKDTRLSYRVRVDGN